MTTLIIATRNAHKVGEIRAILGPKFTLLTLRDFPDAPAVIEDAATFAGNATKKAVELARWIGAQGSRFKVQDSLSVLADDSGLEVDALGGAPGVHSARFAAIDAGAPGNSSDAENNEKLLRLMREVADHKRTARFRCVIALTPVVLDGAVSASPVCAMEESELRTEVFNGSCEGRILFAPGGVGGFGYDPLFVPERYTQSFAELNAEVKNRISHRARALEKLRSRFSQAYADRAFGKGPST